MIQTSQKNGTIRLPEGKRAAVAISCMFNGAAVWTGADGQVSQFGVSRGEHDAVVCVPRILEALRKRDIRATFFIPGHTADTFSDVCRAIVADGHEIAHRSYMLEEHSEMSLEEERQAFERGFEALKRIGASPRGFRAPNEWSQNTLSLLEEYGFVYDCSLMGNDLVPYHPRPVILHTDSGCELGAPSKVMELPVSLHLDDYPYMETMGRDPHLPFFDCALPEELTDRVMDTYQYACRREGQMMNLTIRTASTGQRPRMKAFERMLDRLLEHGAWIAPCGELADAAVFAEGGENNAG